MALTINEHTKNVLLVVTLVSTFILVGLDIFITVSSFSVIESLTALNKKADSFSFPQATPNITFRPYINTSCPVHTPSQVNLSCPQNVLSCPQTILNITEKECPKQTGEEPRQTRIYNARNGDPTCQFSTGFELLKRSYHFKGDTFPWSSRVPAGLDSKYGPGILTALRWVKPGWPADMQTAAFNDKSKIHEVCFILLEEAVTFNPKFCYGQSWSHAHAVNETGDILVGVAGNAFGNVAIRFYMNDQLITSIRGPATDFRFSENSGTCQGDYCFIFGTSGSAKGSTVQYAFKFEKGEFQGTQSVTTAEFAEECDTVVSPGKSFLYCRDNTNNPYRTVQEFLIINGTLTWGAEYKHCTDRSADVPRASTGHPTACETATAGSGGIKGNLYYSTTDNQYHAMRATSTSTREGGTWVSYRTISNTEPTNDSTNKGTVISSDVPMYYYSMFSISSESGRCGRMCFVGEHVIRDTANSKQYADHIVMCASEGSLYLQELTV